MAARRKRTGRRSKNGNKKLIAAIITVLLAIFGFAYKPFQEKCGCKKYKK